MNAMAIVRDGEVIPLTLSDRHRPPGPGFAVGWIHAYPAALNGNGTERAEAMVGETLLALGLRNGIGFPQLIAHPDGRILMIEVAARIPGGQMADLVQHAVGVDLVEVALRFATGEPIPDELARPKFRQPVAIRFFTAQPGPLPVGRVKSEASLERVLTAPGVVQAASYIVPGETIRPVQRDGDRRGYVIALGATGPEALDRSEQAAALVDVEVE
jgi:biotin carboxylase